MRKCIIFLLAVCIIISASSIQEVKAVGDSCKSDLDCTNIREVCDKPTGKCILVRRPIPIRKIVDNSCESILDCNDGEICSNGECIQAPEPTIPLRRVARDPISCGAYITEDVILNSDDPITQETCNFNALNINAKSITLDCNGHTVRGKSFSESRYYTKGVISGKSGTTVKNCNFENFEYGISLVGSNNNRILNNNFTNIYSKTFNLRNSSSNIFKGNIITLSDGIHFSESSTGNRFDDNYFSIVPYTSGPANHFIYVGSGMEGTTNQVYKNDFHGGGFFVNEGGITFCVGSNGNHYGPDVLPQEIPSGDCPATESWTGYAPPEFRNPISCGDEITKSVVLTSDDPVTQRVCDEDGIRILTPNVVLDCDGLEIKGRSRGSVGIYISGARLAGIKNCIVDGFDYGVHLDQTTTNHVRDSHFKNIGSYAGLFTNARFSNFRNNIVEGGNGLDFSNTNNYPGLGNNVFLNYFSTNLRFIRSGVGASNQIYRNDFLDRGIIDDPYDENFYCLGSRGNYYGDLVQGASRKTSATCNASETRWTDYDIEAESISRERKIPVRSDLDTKINDSRKVIQKKDIRKRPTGILDNILDSIGNLFGGRSKLDSEKPESKVARPKQLEPAFSHATNDTCEIGVTNCPRGEFCFNGECLNVTEIIGAMASCEEDSNCDSGEVCREGKCRALRQPRPIPEDLNVTIRVIPTCRNNDECPNELGHEGVCVDGQCILRQPVSCETRSDCFGWLCINNRCADRPPNTDDSRTIPPDASGPSVLDWVNALISKVQEAIIGRGAGEYAPDADEDGIHDREDNCPRIENPEQSDADGDGIGDVCDETPNGDEYPEDNSCTINSDCEILEFCHESICIQYTDYLANIDNDGDGLVNGEDNCPNDYNPGQADDDSDGIGNICDTPAPVEPGPVDLGEKRLIVINDLEMRLDADHANMVTDVLVDGESRLETLSIWDYCILDWWICTETVIGALCGGDADPFYELEPFFEEPPCGTHQPNLHDLLIHGVRLLLPNPTLRGIEADRILRRSDTYFNYLEIPIPDELTNYDLQINVGIWEDVSLAFREAFPSQNHPDFSIWSPRIEESINCDGNRIIERYTFPVEHNSGTLVLRLNDFLPSDGWFRENGYC